MPPHLSAGQQSPSKALESTTGGAGLFTDDLPIKLPDVHYMWNYQSGEKINTSVEYYPTNSGLHNDCWATYELHIKIQL